jgi:predicted metal-dependent peptidase
MAPCRNQHVIDALAFINYRCTFYAYVLDQSLTVIVVPADNPFIRTAATDGVRLWINEAFAARLTVPQLAFVICHEVEHYMADDTGKMHHYDATKTVPSLAKPGTMHPYSQRVLNIALDAIHNGRLVTNTFLTMPTNPDGSVLGVLMDGSDGEPAIDPFADTFLHAYDILMANPSPPPPPPPPEKGKGKGAGPNPQPGDDSAPGDPATPGDDADEESDLDVHVINDLPDAPDSTDPVEKLKREQVITNAAAAAELRQPGSTPMHVKGMLRQFKDDRQVEWTVHLRELMTRAMSGPTKRDWTRLDTRRLQFHGVVCPPTQPRQTKPIAFIIDTSGSTASYRARFLTEAVGLASEMLPQEITLIFIDTRIQRIDTYKPKAFVEQAQSLAGVEWPSGGGTNLDAAFERIATLDTPPAAVVTLTDSELSWPDADPLPGCVFLTATIGHDQHHPAWMTVIPITK